MMSGILIDQAEMYFSYNGFSVFDHEFGLPSCRWTQDHVNQGFARKDYSIDFMALMEFGNARLTVSLEKYNPNRIYNRVIAVPIHVQSGQLRIEGPEEYPLERKLKIATGFYRLYVAQLKIDEENEMIDIFLEPATDWPGRSEILLADSYLHPPEILLETAPPL